MAVQKWEYCETYDPDTRELAELGDEGWELVATDPKSPNSPTRYVFKRPKERKNKLS